jgi:hypothetical protein
MFAHRTATGLTVALLALPATATAMPLADQSGGGEASSSQPSSNYDDWGGDPHPRTTAPTSSPAGTTAQSFVSPDTADAARAGEIARAMEHYQRSLPTPAAAEPASHTGDAPAWPEIAFAGIAVLATAGGIVRVRLRRARRVPA